MKEKIASEIKKRDIKLTIKGIERLSIRELVEILRRLKQKQ